MIRFPCPSCGARLVAKPERAGRKTACPRCRVEVEVPAAETPPPEVPLPDDYYERLQVTPSADPEVIAAAYRRLSLKYHPDRNPDGGRAMALLNEAFEVLNDPARRRAYDADRRPKPATSGPESAAQHSTAREDPGFVDPPLHPIPDEPSHGVLEDSRPFNPNISLPGLIVLYGICGPIAVYGLLSCIGLRILLPLAGTFAALAFVAINRRVVSKDVRRYVHADENGPKWMACFLVGWAIFDWSTGTDTLWGTGAGLGALAFYAYSLRFRGSWELASNVERVRRSHLIAVAAATVVAGGCLALVSPARYEERAMAAAARGDHAAAVEAYTHAIRLDGNEARYFLRRGDAYSKLGKLERARDDFTAALQRSAPGAWEPLASRGLVQYRRKSYHDAISDFSEAEVILRAKLGELGREIPSSAAELAAMRRLLACELSLRADCYEALGDRTRAAQDREESRRLDPNPKK